MIHYNTRCCGSQLKTVNCLLPTILRTSGLTATFRLLEINLRSRHDSPRHRKFLLSGFRQDRIRTHSRPRRNQRNEISLCPIRHCRPYILIISCFHLLPIRSASSSIPASPAYPECISAQRSPRSSTWRMFCKISRTLPPVPCHSCRSSK